MKKSLTAILISGAFILGMNCSDDIKKTKSLLNNKISETGYERPYSIRVVNVNGEYGIETYLFDTDSGQSKRILKNMELEEEYNTTDFLVDIYQIFN